MRKKRHLVVHALFIIGSGFGRWDSPRVPLAQDETFDLSDIESAPSEESLHRAMQTSGKGESAVTQFDRYVMARKQSERDLLADIRENGDEEDGGPHQRKVPLYISMISDYILYHDCMQ